jgi:hypothetical protein
MNRAILDIGPGLLETFLGLPEGVRIVDIRMRAVGFEYAPGAVGAIEILLDGPGLPEAREGAQLQHVAGVYRAVEGRAEFERFSSDYPQERWRPAP